MKQLVVMALALFSLCGYAQEQSERSKKRNDRNHRSKNMTPDQIATLKTKRITLDLDLTNAQKDEIYKLNLAEAKSRKARLEERKQRTKEDRYKSLNERLDRQIAHKKKMRSILNDSQYQKWEQGQKRKVKKRKLQRHRKGIHKRY